MAVCQKCDNSRWVCEDHPNLPWDGSSDAPNACDCGGAGAPCLVCNPCDEEHAPQMPPGYESFMTPDD